MTRTEAIETIAANLSRLGEEDLVMLVEVTTSMTQPSGVFKLTDAERLAVERSREDFTARGALMLTETVELREIRTGRVMLDRGSR